MLPKIIDWSIRNKFFVVLLTAFAIIGGIYAMRNTPVDAIPDLSDVQVIIYTKFDGQSPRLVEDQVTYPLTTAMVSVPRSTVVRGYSFFGYSLVYVIFEDGTDIYWARSRVLEYLNYAANRLPKGVEIRAQCGGRRYRRRQHRRFRQAISSHRRSQSFACSQHSARHGDDGHSQKQPRRRRREH